MTVPESVERLVERFHENRDALKQASYGETEVRVQFIDPLFEALGWDVRNTSGRSPGDMDVIHEDAIKVGVAHKAPDYGFYAGRERKFFVEAKRPSVNLRDNPEPAYQLRRYAWTAKLPLSVLTDFEEFVIYDARVQPRSNDSSAVARIHHITYDQYLDRWDDIAGIFSRDAVYEGSIDRWIDKHASPRGKETVDQAFLNEIERWRERLAQSIALYNPELSQRELNHAVQITVDRILFLRMAEDRQTEEYGRLLGLVNGGDIYARLQGLFRQADERYNSGLFHFREERGRPDAPDDLTPNLKIDDRTLRDIFTNLYYPNSPYEFSVLPVDVLGQVYEQFLGKVITLTSSRSVKIEEKPEVRKAGGVYYTPIYIVDYIVEHTVGKLLEGKTPRQAEKLRILDPACGSGSFLIGAYQYLLDWYRDRYVEAGPDKHAKKLYQAVGGGWKLATEERKRILRNNIYGVDIDPQAVEVTKLSLLLKLLEGETSQTLNRQLSFVQERVLPDLGDNIKCGNSLIGPDFYDDIQMTLLPAEDQYRVNVFDWDIEFHQVLRTGGFDAVIGNPPWGAEFAQSELSYLRQRNREVIVRMIDSFMYFVYQTASRLSSNGWFGMVLPDVILYQNDNRALRGWILEEHRVEYIVNLGDAFDGVTRPASILVFQKSKSLNRSIQITSVSRLPMPEKRDALNDKRQFLEVAQDDLLAIPGKMFLTEDPSKYQIWRRVTSIPHLLLEEIVDEDGIQRGVSPDLKAAFIVDSDTAGLWELETHKLKKVVTGGVHVKRYYIDSPDLWLIHTSSSDQFRDLPNICRYIDQYQDRITCKEVIQGKHSLYALHRARKTAIFTKPQKIIGVITEDEIIVGLDSKQRFATDGVYVFGVRDEYDPLFIMGILNSRFFVFVYRLLSLENGRVLAQVKPTTLKQLPIPIINPSAATETTRRERIAFLAKQMIVLNEKAQNARAAHDKTVLQRQIEATDRQIDRLVYELYDLTEEEIAIVESQT